MNQRMLTTAGHKTLVEEADRLRRDERPKVVKGVSDAAAEGDRSENAEYIYGKKKLREIDKRLQYLAGLLKDVQVVDPDSISSEVIQFGATVRLEDEDGEERLYTIVGEGEADLKNGTISYQAPVARALLGKQVGDVVLVQRPKGEIQFEVMAMRYGTQPWQKAE